MLGDGPEQPEREDAKVADTRMRLFSATNEVAALAMMFASGEATYMTGTELTIDGGIFAGSAAIAGS